LLPVVLVVWAAVVVAAAEVAVVALVVVEVSEEVFQGIGPLRTIEKGLVAPV
jgi:hypothetical protein